VADYKLALGVNGRSGELKPRLIPFHPPAVVGGPGPGRQGGRSSAVTAAGPDGDGHPRHALSCVAIVGLGYVGLPTALALHGRCERIIGVDISERRLAVIAAGRADLGTADRPTLAAALADGTLELTSDIDRISHADAIIICVPTPVDGAHNPDLAALRGACAEVVTRARAGQTLILTSTTYIGTTRELLAGPLSERGLRPGSEVFVAFSPERIDPGNSEHVQRETPRVVGGVTPACSTAAATVLAQLTDSLYLLSSPEAAEATKLYENIFRAVTLALANEFSDACAALGVDPIEVTLAASTKPYGFLGAFPGPGVGGHCIPCDPHYLLWQLGKAGRPSPLIEQAMRSISGRPARVVERAGQILASDGGDLAGAAVVVVGVSYKAGVADLRESPALGLMAGLLDRGAKVSYFDPLVPEVSLAGGQRLVSVTAPRGADYDLAIIHTLHPGGGSAWASECPRVLDATYVFEEAAHRSVL
jgi:UDP-N-acetyl-D-glucosamine dehydrogenase